MAIDNTYYGNATGYLAWVEGGVSAVQQKMRIRSVTVAATAATRVEFRDGDGSGLLKLVIELGGRGTSQVRFAPDSLPFRTKLHITLTGTAEVFVYG